MILWEGWSWWFQLFLLVLLNPLEKGLWWLCGKLWACLFVVFTLRKVVRWGADLDRSSSNCRNDYWIKHHKKWWGNKGATLQLIVRQFATLLLLDFQREMVTQEVMKKDSYSLQVKLDVMKTLDRGVTYRKITEEYVVPSSTIGQHNLMFCNQRSLKSLMKATSSS